jgi:hypothetical protein
MEILICCNAWLSLRWMRVRSFVTVASTVVPAGVMIGVVLMGVVRSRLRMLPIGHV